MEKINLSSIKRESVKSIFNSIAEKNKVSRADISYDTGLSLMTVGKVIDALIERNILCQSKESKTAAGRKAGLVNLNTDNFIIVIDLTSRNFIMSVIDIGLNMTDKMVYDYNNDFYFEENLYIFLKNVKIYLLRRFEMNLCIGLGVAVPGPYNYATDTVRNISLLELNDIKINGIINEVLKFPASYIDEDVNVAALSNITCIDNFRDVCVSYIYIGERVGGAVIVSGSLLKGAGSNAGNIGMTVTGNGKTLEKAVKSAAAIEDAVYDISVALCNLIWLIDPHVIIIESDKVKFPEDFSEKVYSYLSSNFNLDSQKLPKIILSSSNIRHSHRGIALKLREKWLDKFIT